MENQTYVMFSTDQTVNAKVRTFLAMNDTVRCLRAAESLQAWHTLKDEFCAALTKHRVRKLASTAKHIQYNREWVFRTLQVALRKLYQNNWLYVSATDLISDLPGPDQSGNIPKLIQAIGGDIGVKQMYERYHIKSPPELVSMNLCLQSGNYAHNLGKTAQAKKRVEKGPCENCKAACKGATYCRILKSHTAPAAAPGQMGRPPKK